jgi:predicted O-linked N-acetylglucosamine transferase (SPINDLY family)
VTPYEDAESERLRAKAALWRRVGHLPPAELARQIRADRVDIAIETSGLTDGHRLAAMRYRPAPVQITAIGYPATTGVPEIDYRLVDSITDPAGVGEGQMTERPLRLDPCFLCFTPPAPGEAPAPRSEIRDSKSEIVFGSFSALSKLDDATVRLWTAVLKAVPNSRVVVKALALREASVRARVARRFAEAGAEPERVDIREPQAGLIEHLGSYGDLDVALDTYPYCGTTTTCEALSMGVPVLTLAGNTHASRVGASLMTAVGLPELVAETPEAFVNIAAELAADRARLAAIRAGLRERLVASVLCDRAGYAARLGAALRVCWKRACEA